MKIIRDIKTEEDEKRNRRKANIVLFIALLFAGAGVYISVRKGKPRYRMYSSRSSDETIDSDIYSDFEKEEFVPEMFYRGLEDKDCNIYRNRLIQSIEDRDICYASNPPQFIDEGPFSYDTTMSKGDIESYVNNMPCNVIMNSAPEVIAESFRCMRDNPQLASPSSGFRPIREEGTMDMFRQNTRIMSPTDSESDVSRYFKTKMEILKDENRRMKRKLRNCIPMGHVNRRYEE